MFCHKQVLTPSFTMVCFLQSSSVMEFPPNIPPHSGGMGQHPNSGGQGPPTNTGGNRPSTGTGGNRPPVLVSPQVPQVIIGIFNRALNQNVSTLIDLWCISSLSGK